MTILRRIHNWLSHIPVDLPPPDRDVDEMEQRVNEVIQRADTVFQARVRADAERAEERIRKAREYRRRRTDV